MVITEGSTVSEIARMTGLNAFSVRPGAVRIASSVVSENVVCAPNVMRVVPHEVRVTCGYFQDS